MALFLSVRPRVMTSCKAWGTPVLSVVISAAIMVRPVARSGWR
ncbi:hypothetical protein LAUMK42_05573 [Mycobacterium persicum]|uniref:Uncharacterized protein n=1 Tax=Mycobacterium persicum TaxID=1487726 RepID=A0AB38V139_9MYCO|nr:hypothetical protein LAUMK42_05573 [Mycobacterium persicum]